MGRIEKDAEMMALGKCIDLIAELEEEARQRVLAYLTARFHCDVAVVVAPAKREAGSLKTLFGEPRSVEDE